MPESDVSLELDIECPIISRPLSSVSSGLGAQIQLQETAAVITKPTSAVAHVRSGSHAFCFNPKGALWLRTSAPPGRLLVPAGSLTFVRGGTRVIALAARGEHQVTTFTWNAGLSSALENWILGRAGTRQAPIRVMASQAVSPKLGSPTQRFFDALRSPSEASDPMLISALFELCGSLLGNTDQLRLTHDSFDPTESLGELTQAVRADPTAPWPLAEAAARAGYSPFHFSRVFKSAVGYGFHEYVERCRTELACEMLISTSNPVDIVASAAGFGTPQSLRDSMKQYIGFVPSELRNANETLKRPNEARLI